MSCAGDEVGCTEFLGCVPASVSLAAAASALSVSSPAFTLCAGALLLEEATPGDWRASLAGLADDISRLLYQVASIWSGSSATLDLGRASFRGVMWSLIDPSAACRALVESPRAAIAAPTMPTSFGCLTLQ